MTAFLALLLYSSTVFQSGDPLASAGTSLGYAALTVLIGVVDIERRRVPVRALLPLVALALFDAAIIVETRPNLTSAIFGGGVGFLIFYLVFAGGFVFAAAAERILKRIIPGSAFGFGDVMLMGVIGISVGFPNILAVICISILAAGIGAIVLIVRQVAAKGSYRGLARMPYAPYILLAALLVRIWGSQWAELFAGV
jgi:prepilin signal peptidase PulO-like enzyme (type II secretory pathway)